MHYRKYSSERSQTTVIIQFSIMKQGNKRKMSHETTNDPIDLVLRKGITAMCVIQLRMLCFETKFLLHGNVN